jgi:hypothetical protein
VGLSEPDVRLSTTLNGPERTTEIQQLQARPAPPRFTAYAHLILQMLNSDPMLFIRGDEAEQAWRIAKHHGTLQPTLSRSIQPQRARRSARARTDTPTPPARAPSRAYALPAEPARSQRSRRRRAPPAMGVLACRSSVRYATDSHPDNRGRRAEHFLQAAITQRNQVLGALSGR